MLWWTVWEHYDQGPELQEQRRCTGYCPRRLAYFDWCIPAQVHYFFLWVLHCMVGEGENLMQTKIVRAEQQAKARFPAFYKKRVTTIYHSICNTFFHWIVMYVMVSHFFLEGRTLWTGGGSGQTPRREGLRRNPSSPPPYHPPIIIHYSWKVY